MEKEEAEKLEDVEIIERTRRVKLEFITKLSGDSKETTIEM